jgi:hypothetical protein
MNHSAGEKNGCEKLRKKSVDQVGWMKREKVKAADKSDYADERSAT